MLTIIILNFVVSTRHLCALASCLGPYFRDFFFFFKLSVLGRNAHTHAHITQIEKKTYSQHIHRQIRINLIGGYDFDSFCGILFSYLFPPSCSSCSFIRRFAVFDTVSLAEHNFDFTSSDLMDTRCGLLKLFILYGLQCRGCRARNSFSSNTKSSRSFASRQRRVRLCSCVFRSLFNIPFRRSFFLQNVPRAVHWAFISTDWNHQHQNEFTSLLLSFRERNVGGIRVEGGCVATKMGRISFDIKSFSEYSRMRNQNTVCGI